jgi:Chain length determinant protein
MRGLPRSQSVTMMPIVGRKAGRQRGLPQLGSRAAGTPEGDVATESTEVLAVVGYLGVMARWKWLIVAVTAVCGVAGLAYVKTRTPMYRASAQLIYVQPVTTADPLVEGGGRSNAESARRRYRVRYGREQSGRQRCGAASQWRGHVGRLPRESRSTDGQRRKPGANVMEVEGVPSSPQTAADAANAYAEALFEWRRVSSSW